MNCVLLRGGRPDVGNHSAEIDQLLDIERRRRHWLPPAMADFTAVFTAATTCGSFDEIGAQPLMTPIIGLLFPSSSEMEVVW